MTVKGSLEAIVDVERNKQYRTDIRAYNLADLEYNESEKKRLQGEPDTIYPVNGERRDYMLIEPIPRLLAST